MSRIRDINIHDSDGTDIIVDSAGNLPIAIGDATGAVLTLEPNGSLPVTVQDQTTPSVFILFNQVEVTTTLAVAAVVDDMSITVASAVGINVGSYIGLFNTTTDRFYVGTVVALPGGNVLDMDTPIDSSFEIGDVVGSGINNLAVDGTITQTFTVRGADPGIDVTVDITRIIFQCITDTAVDLSKFGDIVGGLVNGLVLRRVDGTTQNIFNVKTNGDIANIMYDWQPFAADNPVQGVDGFSARLTFAGQSKIGVALRLGPGEDLEFLVQDDLTQIATLKIMAEGHVALV